jgi:predicted PurR-regulated permease PerM
LIQQRAVDIPPAILLAMQLIGGVFGGVLGILLAAPTALIAAAVAREAVAANGAHG